MKRAAIKLVERGMAVFPLKPRDKIPLTKHGCLDARGTPERIEHGGRNGHKRISASLPVRCPVCGCSMSMVQRAKRPFGEIETRMGRCHRPSRRSQAGAVGIFTFDFLISMKLRT